MNVVTPVEVGIVLALVSVALGRFAGFDRDRAFYPTMGIVVASYYSLFAAVGGTPAAVWTESLIALLFAAAAIAGFRHSLWWAVVAIAGHGLFDAVHGRLVANPGVPASWPAFCLTFDVVAGGALAVLLLRRDVRERDASRARSEAAR